MSTIKLRILRDMLNFYIRICIQSQGSSNASPPPKTSPRRVATAEGPSPLPVHTLPPCLLQTISLTHVLLHPIFPSPKWPSPPTRTLNTTQIHLNKFLIFHPLSMVKLSQGAPFHPLHHTKLHQLPHSCHISHIHSYCSHHPI